MHRIDFISVSNSNSKCELCNEIDKNERGNVAFIIEMRRDIDGLQSINACVSCAAGIENDIDFIFNEVIEDAKVNK